MTSPEVRKIKLEPGQWSKVELYGWQPREGTLPGATVGYYYEVAALGEELAKVLGFSHIAGFSVEPGGIYEPGAGPDGELGESIPIPHRMPDGKVPGDGERPVCSCGCPG
jgi:hypothetical protein